MYMYIAYFCVWPIYLSWYLDIYFGHILYTLETVGKLIWHKNILNTVLIRICKWSKDMGNKHYQLISKLSDARMVRMGIIRICL